MSHLGESIGDGSFCLIFVEGGVKTVYNEAVQAVK